MIRTTLSLGATVAVAVGLAALWPERMLSPGLLAAGHQPVEGDCFACHEPLRGTPRPKCVACHALDGLGLRTVAGAPLPSPNPRVQPLHRAVQGECTGCHGEHGGRTREKALARFAHSQLGASVARDCAACHLQQRPADPLHEAAGTGCAQCHDSSGWRPARYDHEKLFRFDRNHPPTCSACHPGGKLETYSCTGCHEHSPDKMAREHAEEGIRDLEKCARCHRSGSGEGEREGGREGEGGRGGGGEREGEGGGRRGGERGHGREERE